MFCDNMLIDTLKKEFDSKKIFYFKKLDSTMIEAKKIATTTSNFSVVIAESQELGKGRLTRVWVSEEGGLYFTVIINKNILLSDLSQINLAAPFILQQNLLKLFGIEAKLKWPNDVLINGRKVAGILSEAKIFDNNVVFFNVGVGINVNNDVKIQNVKTTSIKKVVGKKCNRSLILINFLKDFQLCVEKKDFKNLNEKFKDNSDIINKVVRVETLDKIEEGKVIDIDQDANLILETKNGQIKKILYGDCFYKK